MIHKIILAAALFLFASANAQDVTVKIKVLEFQDNSVELPDAEISVKQSNWEQIGKTDAHGTCSAKLKEGFYTVRAFKPGIYAKQEEQFTISSQNPELTIYLVNDYKRLMSAKKIEELKSRGDNSSKQELLDKTNDMIELYTKLNDEVNLEYYKKVKKETEDLK